MAEFAVLGWAVPPEMTGAAPPQPETFEVSPVNWTAAKAFLACATQWRVAVGVSGLVWLGLDYAAVDVVLRRTGAEAAFDDIRVMEDAALAVFEEHAR